MLECATSTVVVAVRRYQEGGRQGLRDRRERNGRAKVDERFRERLACVLEGTPEDWGWCRPSWTRELLCQELALRGQVRVSVATMGRTLVSLGARLKAAKPVVECPWPSWKRQRRLLELKCLEVNGIHPPLPPVVLPRAIASSGCGSTCMPMSPATTAAAPWTSSWSGCMPTSPLAMPSAPPVHRCAESTSGAHPEAVRESRSLVSSVAMRRGPGV
ncbi:helix-turn-helix domain-containing protein [Myxococcus sp. AB056]|uniref:helix-turn-helix domain-containing protein n=1 Tax=Myxococcus sp. AB056 TaxID=2562792 RepID=UPI002104F31B|nr:helix-turn-helix domain-containing protein [Myxococcus sp. AB056]